MQFFILQTLEKNQRVLNQKRPFGQTFDFEAFRKTEEMQLVSEQCDQITRLFAWFLAIICKENLPNCL